MDGFKNIPTVSDPEIMQRFPKVRMLERDTLIDCVNINNGDHILDIQAAGGYLSDEIYRRLDGRVNCYCIEPCNDLRDRLNPVYYAINNQVEHFISINDNQIDIALGLAGLHHSTSHRDTINECFRVLKHEGQLAICDVEENTNIARWLNEYVDTNSMSGHDGRFLKRGMVSNLMKEAGFIDIVEEPKNVPWVFPDRESISIFFKGLFNLQTTLEEIDSVMDDYFTMNHTGSMVSVDWVLIYLFGVKQ